MRYANGAAFRTAIEQRLANEADGRPAHFFDRRRKMIVFDRYLARLLVVAPGRWVLKGGVALNFRLRDSARATLDLDLASDLDEGDVLDFLTDAAELDLGDYFSFAVEHADAFVAEELAGAMRFRVRAVLAGRPFETVTIDVNTSEPFPEEPEIVSGIDFLRFADIPPIEVPATRLTQHLAEKLHAYTRSYGRGHHSSRVKDLVDIALIIEASELEIEDITHQIEQTFLQRSTHAVPLTLPAPPATWTVPYRTMADEVGIDPSIDDALRLAQEFFDPVLKNIDQRAKQSR
ncbi:MAG: nucleotidyl transferase AbiEii/AbiGii toxin family protein [Thermomicrobiales bacterium]|nr:nucleotidyl transferase AbiEii/AbiGii toxin family protein [Thermomicrobiales bacterium]